MKTWEIREIPPPQIRHTSKLLMLMSRLSQISNSSGALSFRVIPFGSILSLVPLVHSIITCRISRFTCIFPRGAGVEGGPSLLLRQLAEYQRRAINQLDPEDMRAMSRMMDDTEH